MYLKDSDGNESLPATISIIGFLIVVVKVLLSGASFAVGGLSCSFGSIDAATVAAVLTPVLGTYAVHKYTDIRYGQQDPSTDGAGSKTKAG